jgi:sugar phosphate isomerase/epimerase
LLELRSWLGQARAQESADANEEIPEGGSTRRAFIGGAAGSAAAVTLGSVPGAATAAGRPGKGKDKRRKRRPDIRAANIGMQLWTVRNFLEDDSLDLDGTFELLSDSGYKTIEIGGTYDGRTPTEFRRLARDYGMRVIGSHVPGGQDAWRNNLELVLDEAEELRIPYVGIAIPAGDVPRTVAGYQALAEEFNEFGAAARERGLKFYFHNHPDDFTIDDGTVIYDVLLEETERRLVWFEMDIAWVVAGGQNPRDYLRDDPRRFPLFHVKDLRFDPEGNRTTPDGVARPGRPFFLTAVGKGRINFARIFSELRDLDDHEYLVEDDDAGDPVVNPAGAANTAWFSRKHLAELNVPGHRRGR